MQAGQDMQHTLCTCITERVAGQEPHIDWQRGRDRDGGERDRGQKGSGESLKMSGVDWRKRDGGGEARGSEGSGGILLLCHSD